MFNLGGGEILVILLAALLVLGPQKLPEAAKTVGRVMGELRKLSGGFQDEIRSAMYEAERPATPVARGASGEPSRLAPSNGAASGGRNGASADGADAVASGVAGGRPAQGQPQQRRRRTAPLRAAPDPGDGEPDKP